MTDEIDAKERGEIDEVMRDTIATLKWERGEERERLEQIKDEQKRRAATSKGSRVLRITPSHSAEGAARYYDAALGRSDYYGQQERGLWAGKGAAMLGLRGEVSREQFVALANNQRPDSKGRLTARTNGTRTESRRVFDPKTQTWEEKEIEVSNRRAGYDICLPQSLEIK
jgi:TrwC relaxase